MRQLQLMGKKTTVSPPPDRPDPVDRPPRLRIQTQEQWTAFCSPARYEMLSALSGLGEASVAEIAFAVDRSADGLYRHIRILLDAELIEECETRRVGRQTEAVYRLAAEEPVVDIDPADAVSRERMREVATLIQRDASKRFCVALDAGICRVGEDDRNTWVRSVHGWLDEDDLAELGGLLGRIEALFASRQARRSGGTLHNCSYMINPVHRDRPFSTRGSQRQEEMLAEAGEETTRDE